MAKKLLRFLVLGLVTFVGCWAVVQYKCRNAPEGLGVNNGGLAECPGTPNCVCSDCDSGDKMPPLQFEGEVVPAMTALKDVLRKKGISVVEARDNYLRAVAVTPIMRFRDDLEFLFDPQERLIHFRSASRLGKSDLGKNRSRLNEIFAELSRKNIKPKAG